MNIKIHAKNSSYDLCVESAEQILMAALNKGIDLPYACATGTCGTCKSKLISGRVKDNWPEAPGKEKFGAGIDEILLCQCSAQADCEIVVPDFVYRADPGTIVPARHTGVITQWRILAPDVALWSIESSETFDFSAGQFVLVGFPGVKGYRAYSMVNFTRQTKQLTFVTKRKPGGILTERMFSKAPVGESVQVVGPFGKAIFNPSLRRNILCIAGGSGIAGIMSILSRAAQEGYFSQYKGYVFFGVRTMRDAFFLDELTSIKAMFEDNLDIVIGFSENAVTERDTAAYPSLSFESGLIHEIACRKMEGKYKNSQAYLAGPAPLVESALRSLVINAKFDPAYIAYDKFN